MLVARAEPVIKAVYSRDLLRFQIKTDKVCHSMADLGRLSIRVLGGSIAFTFRISVQLLIFGMVAVLRAYRMCTFPELLGASVITRQGHYGTTVRQSRIHSPLRWIWIAHDAIYMRTAELQDHYLLITATTNPPDSRLHPGQSQPQ
jgi:hypothetical protein